MIDATKGVFYPSFCSEKTGKERRKLKLPMQSEENKKLKDELIMYNFFFSISFFQ